MIAEAASARRECVGQSTARTFACKVSNMVEQEQALLWSICDGQNTIHHKTQKNKNVNCTCVLTSHTHTQCINDAVGTASSEADDVPGVEVLLPNK